MIVEAFSANVPRTEDFCSSRLYCSDCCSIDNLCRQLNVSVVALCSSCSFDTEAGFTCLLSFMVWRAQLIDHAHNCALQLRYCSNTDDLCFLCASS